MSMRPARARGELTPQLALVAWLAAFVLGNSAAAVTISFTDYQGADVDTFPLWLIAANFAALWVGLLLALVAVSRYTGSGSFKKDYGLAVRPGDAVVGLPVGVIAQLVFVRLLYDVLDRFFDTSELEEPAKELTGKASGLGVVLLIVVVAIGAPIVEELFYRGMVQRAFKARVNDTLAMVVTAVMFALVHFQALQLPGLILFGLVAGYLANRYARLGPAIFAHIGFNGAAVVMLLIDRA